MTSIPPLGQLLQSFFVEHLITVKGLRPASVRSYRDTVRLLLVFAAADKGCKITRLSTGDLTFDLSLARGMGPPDCQGDGTTVARY